METQSTRIMSIVKTSPNLTNAAFCETKSSFVQVRGHSSVSILPQRIPGVPSSVLATLAIAHFFISQNESDLEERLGHENINGEYAALATFCSIVWSVKAWKDALDNARRVGLPDVTLRKLRALAKQAKVLDKEALEAVGTVRKRKYEEEEEEEAESDHILDKASAIEKYGLDWWCVSWRQYGYNLILEAVNETDTVHEELAETLRWCHAEGIRY
ncbi:hypothetical protein LTR85_002523 [Meristemomyces frigidus]|nr:hypothetical protein LTR85_002523 [Meristemomyces frigidus]